jgi:hypothetical protein
VSLEGTAGNARNGTHVPISGSPGMERGEPRTERHVPRGGIAATNNTGSDRKKMAGLVGSVAAYLEQHGPSSQPGLEVQKVVRQSLLDLVEMVLETGKSAKNGLHIVLQLLSISIFEYDWVVEQGLLQEIFERSPTMLARCASEEVLKESALFLARTLESIKKYDRNAYEICLRRSRSVLWETCQVASRGSVRRGGQVDGPRDGNESILQLQSSHIDGHGCECIIAGTVKMCAELVHRVSTALVFLVARSGAEERSVFVIILELMLSPSEMIQMACLDFAEAALRSLVVADRERRAVASQCRLILAALLAPDHNLGEEAVMRVSDRIADVIWILWEDCESMRIELLEMVETLLLHLPPGSRPISRWCRLFCECSIDSPDVGIQFTGIYRHWDVLDDMQLNLHRCLLIAASVVLSQHTKEDVATFATSLRASACIHAKSGYLSKSPTRKRRKLSDRASSSFETSQAQGSQIASPSLGRFIKALLISSYRDLNTFEEKLPDYTIGGMDVDGAERLNLFFDKILLTLTLIAGMSRGVAAEMAQDIFHRISSSNIVHDVRLMLGIQLVTLFHDLCVSQNLAFAEQCLDKHRMAVYSSDEGRSRQSTFLDYFALDLDKPLGKMSSLEHAKPTARSLSFAEFLPLIVLMKSQTVVPAQQRGGSKSSEKPITPQQYLIHAASVSKEAAERIVAGLIVYLDKWPDMESMFDLAREQVFLKQGKCSYASSNNRTALQPRDSKAVSEILYELTKTSEAASDSSNISQLLVQAAIMGFERASLTDSSAWRGLAKFIIHEIQSKGKSAQVLLERLSVLQCESFVLALTVQKDHPISSKDRRSASILGESDVVKAFQRELPMAISESAAFQNILVALESCALSMRNANAVNLSLVILICHLESKDLIIAALAAQSLLRVAAAKGLPLKDMLLQNDLLLEILGPRLPRKTDLLIELAELLGMKDRTLLAACMPTILPSIWAKGGSMAITGLAKQLGTSTQQLLLRYGEYPLTSSFIHRMPTMEEFLRVSKELLGEELDGFVASITPRTLSQLILEMGGDQSWNDHQGSLPDTLADVTALSITVLMGKLQDPSPKGSEVTMMLAEGDHVTRLLKHLGDKFDSHPTKSSKLKIIRGLIFLIKATGKYVGRHLPQFLVLLSASIRRSSPLEVRVQGLIGMAYLIRSLSTFAPVLLGSCSNQITVALLDSLQTAGPVGKLHSKLSRS